MAGCISVRIISGTLRGRSLNAPKGQGVRPTSDQVKESLFNIIGPKIVQATVLDLFAGTGNLGIEAISRAAARVVFVEKVLTHFQVLKRNLSDCGVEAKSDAYCGDANTMLRVLQRKYGQFDVIFLDPPYRHTKMLREVIAQIVRRELLAEDGLLIVEHAQTFTPPTEAGDLLRLEKTRRFGDTCISFYQFNLS